MLFLPVVDYLVTRKKLLLKFSISAFPAIIALIYSMICNMRNNIDIAQVFSSFVNVQISAIAILISFSIAIITILVSSDSKNVEKLRNTVASLKNYKPTKSGETLTLFQVLLTNITYNVFVEIVYLGLLICQIFLQLVLGVNALKYLTVINIFFITHILLVLLESIVHIYLTFWKDPKDEN